MAGDVAYEFKEAGLRMAAEASVTAAISTQLGLVLADDTVYLQVPPLFRLFAGAEWVRVDLSADSEERTLVDDLLESLAAEVPGQTLLELDGRADDVALRYLGEGEAQGSSVERYEVRATVDGVDVTRTYWVGDDDLLRRLDSSAKDPAELDPAVSVHTYDQWGEPVSIEPPPPEEVGEFPEGLL